MAEWRPLIIAASCVPNPVTVGAQTVLSVMVIDSQVGQMPDTWGCNEVYSGEV